MSVQVVKLERPNPRQEEFLKCEKKYVAFGGARGGGKSWAVRTKAVPVSYTHLMSRVFWPSICWRSPSSGRS